MVGVFVSNAGLCYELVSTEYFLSVSFQVANAMEVCVYVLIRK